MKIEELFKSDPLSEVTRKDRRVLLAISVIGIVIVRANIIPTKLTAFGIEFGKTDQNFLLFAILLITSYFLFAFAIYAFSDFLEFQIDFSKLLRESKLLEKDEKRVAELGADRAVTGRNIDRSGRYINISMGVLLIRGIFEFFFPCIIALYSMLLLLTANIP